MSKKIRYSLILIGFVVFAVLAPAIVIYVRGLTYNFTTHRFVSTGILSLKTDPKTVDVFLNQKLVSQASGDLRFLVPQEYDLRLSRPGYFDWVKRLTILPDSVGWVYPAYTKIYLLKNPPIQTKVNADVLDFYQNGDTIAYLTENNLILSSLSNLTQSQNYSLPKSVDTILAAANNNFVLGGNSSGTPTILLFQNQTKTFTDLSLHFKQTPQFQFAGSTLYALAGGTLYTFGSDQKPQSILGNIKTFVIDDNTLYYIAQTSTSTNFSISQWPFSGSQTIMANLPTMKEAKIVIDSNKHVFLIADNRLYRLATNLVPLAQNITDYGFDEPRTQLVYVAGGEVHQYNPLSDTDTLLTRSVSPLQNIILSTEYNYVFYSDEAGVTALDLNTNSPRNEYPLYFGQIKKLALNSGVSTLLLLDGTTLKALVIR